MNVRIDTTAFFNLWKDKEKALGRTLTLAEAAASTGLAHETIRKIRDGKTTRFDGPVIGGLCKLLDVPPGLIPFLVYEPD